MKMVLFFILLIPTFARANFIFQYGLNYSSQKDATSSSDYDANRTFHKVFLGASVNGGKTLFLGWNTHSWTSSVTKSSVEDTYSMTEMGPRLLYFFSDDYNAYISADWNPYAVGARKKSSTSSDIRGSSMDFALGYRFKLNRYVGLGAGIHYHMLTLSDEKIGTTESSVSDKITNLMPMLEFTFITR